MSNRWNLYVRVMVAVAVLASGILAGCAVKKYVMVEKPKGVMLEYLMPTGEVLKYKNTQDSDQTMEMMGMSVETKIHKAYEFSVAGKGREGDNYNLNITIDAMDGTMTTPQGEMAADVDPVIGKSFGMTLSRLGKELDVSEAEAIEYGVGPQGNRSIMPDFKTMFPDLPAAPADIGDTWTSRDTVAIEEGGIGIVIISESVNTLVGFEPMSGFECAKVTADVTGTVKGEGEQQGAQVSFDGTLSGTDTWYFAYEEGILVEMSSDIFSESTIQVTGPQEMTIPMKQKMSFDTVLTR